MCWLALSNGVTHGADLASRKAYRHVCCSAHGGEFVNAFDLASQSERDVSALLSAQRWFHLLFSPESDAFLLPNAASAWHPK